MRQYIGARYVPKFADPILHDSTRSYEALEMVQNAIGDSFTSKKPVPIGVALTNSEYWVQTGNFNSQLSLLQSEVATIPHKKKVLVLGDSYAQGIGSSKTMGEWIEDLTGWDCDTYYEGGCGYLRESANLKKMIDVVGYAIAGETEPLQVTDVVLAASVYNDSGLSSDPSFTKANFATQLTNCVNALRSVFTNAKITVIPGLWVTSQVNSTLVNIATWLADTARVLGCGYDPDSLNWLQIFIGVASSDNVHPNSSGYEIISSHIASVIEGTRPSLIDTYDEIATNTNDAINVKTNGNMVHIYGSITRESGQTFTNLCTLPNYCQRLVNVPFEVFNYNSQEIKRGVILSKNMILASDQLTVGATYLIDITVPLCTYNA